jgi:hypothetical protein
MRYKSKQGDVFRYSIRMRIFADLSRARDLPPNTNNEDIDHRADIHFLLSEQVLAVAAKSFTSRFSSKMISKQTWGIFKEADEALAEMAFSESETHRMDFVGRTLSAPPGPEVAFRLMVFCERAVKPGDSWKAGGATYTYWGTEWVAGTIAHEVTSDTASMVEGKRIFASTRAFVEIRTGRFITQRSTLRLEAEGGIAMVWDLSAVRK